MKLVKPPLWLPRAFRMFPIRSGAKFPPCFDDNLALASNDRQRIVQWAAKYPGANWGVALAPSHLIALDCDTKPGKRGQESLERLEIEHGRLPRTFTVRTPSGGDHFYFREANGVKHRMRLSAFGPDIDSPNYTVLPGSVLLPRPDLPKGGQYGVAINAPMADAPAWFAKYLDVALIGDNSQIPAVEQDTADLILGAIQYLKRDAPPSIQYSNGEFTLLMVAATLKDMGISEGMAVDLLAEHYNSRCSPPWNIGDGADADRLEVKVHNAWLYLHQNQPGSATAQFAFGDDPLDAADLAALDVMIAWWKERDKQRTIVSRKPINDGLIETGRTVLIDGERVPIVKAVS